MAAETILNLNPKSDVETSFDAPGHIRVTRIYAMGGLVVTDFINFKTGKADSRVMQPHEAMDRARAIARMPKKVNYHKFIQAIVDACDQAARQSIDGQAPLLDPQYASVADMAADEMRKVNAEIAEARKKDPELDEEMKKAEFEARQKTFMEPYNPSESKLILPAGHVK